jgi:adenosylhomocysteine nucleosidase
LDQQADSHFIAVTGLAFEASIVAGPGVTVLCGSGHLYFKRALEQATRQGCRGIISFGIAGGLAPHLKPGACVVARNVVCEQGRYPSHVRWAQSLLESVRDSGDRREVFGGAFSRDICLADIAGSDVVVASAEHKRSIYEKTGAVAVDMESHIAARFAAEHRLPFAAFRVVTDPSHRALPPAALVATTRTGTINVGAVFMSLLRQPKQLPTLFQIGLDSWAARRSLVPSRRFFGTTLALPDHREKLLDVA